MARSKPANAATRDTSRRKSSWLVTKKHEDPSTKPCGTCNGTGSSGWYNAKGELITCPDCHGWGY